MLATADCCKEDAHGRVGGVGGGTHSHAMDSDSEDEGNTGVPSAGYGHHSGAVHPGVGASSGVSVGPFSLVLEDLRRMEYPLASIEDSLLRGDAQHQGTGPIGSKKDSAANKAAAAQQQAAQAQQRMLAHAQAQAAQAVGHTHGMSAVPGEHPNGAVTANMLGGVVGVPVVPMTHSVAVNNPFLTNALIGRSGHCCLLTDSQDFAVRRHQLKVLSEEFSDVDFVKFIESSVMRGGAISYNTISAPMFGKMKQLLVRLVELERSHADGVMTCKQKDFVRAMEIIPGVAERGNEADETVMRARMRAEEISGCVHRLLTQL